MQLLPRVARSPLSLPCTVVHSINRTQRHKQSLVTDEVQSYTPARRDLVLVQSDFIGDFIVHWSQEVVHFPAPTFNFNFMYSKCPSPSFRTLKITENISTVQCKYININTPRKEINDYGNKTTGLYNVITELIKLNVSNLRTTLTENISLVTTAENI